MRLGSASPTPGTGPSHCLLDSPPGRLRSGSSRRGTTRPSWLRTTEMGHPLVLPPAEMGNPHVRIVPKRPARRHSPPPSQDLPPSSPWRTSAWHNPPYSDTHEDSEAPLSDLSRPLSRPRPPTPHPRSSSTLNHWLELDDGDDDTLPYPDEEMEAARSRASPRWLPEDSFVAPAPLVFEDILEGGLKLSEPDAGPPRLPPMLASSPLLTKFRRTHSDEWQEIKALINRARGRVSRQRTPPVNDRWGFAMTRGMTSGYEPYQYNGTPSSDDRRSRRRPLRSVSPIEFSPTPSPPESASSSHPERHMYTSSQPGVQTRFTPPPPLRRRRRAWRGRQLLEAYLHGDRRWPAPRNWEPVNKESDNSDEEEVAHSSEPRELSPASLAEREARIRHFHDIDTNYQLHVEHVGV